MEAPPGFEPGMEVLQGTQRLKALREVVCFSAFTRPSTTLSEVVYVKLCNFRFMAEGVIG